MTQIARKYNIDVSILSSDLDYAGGVKFGMMVAEILVMPTMMKPRFVICAKTT